MAATTNSRYISEVRRREEAARRAVQTAKAKALAAAADLRSEKEYPALGGATTTPAAKARTVWTHGASAAPPPVPMKKRPAAAATATATATATMTVLRLPAKPAVVRTLHYEEADEEGPETWVDPYEQEQAAADDDY